MKEYKAHFSFYCEQSGNFSDVTKTIEAANQFEARTKAWEALSNDDDLVFMSCIKLCGITWDASKLDLQDYFNAEAAQDKYRLKYVESVEKPNAQIEKNEDALTRCEQERSAHYGSLHTISHITEDLGKPHGMLPPTIFEELHYARQFLNLIDGSDYEKYMALHNQIESAEKWDSTAIFSIRESFKTGYFFAGGHDFDFRAQFGKDGIYPVFADLSDYESKHIGQWTAAREYKNMAALPFFGEKDTIPHSDTMQYAWQTLVVNKEALHPDNQVPVNALWIANQESAGDYETSGNSKITVENPITGAVVEANRTDFIGVLRPEKNAKINFDGIKAEYLAQNAEKPLSTDRGIVLGSFRELPATVPAQKSKEHTAPNTKPSILKSVEDSKNKIAQATPKPVEQKKKDTAIE